MRLTQVFLRAAKSRKLAYRSTSTTLRTAIAVLLILPLLGASPTLAQDATPIVEPTTTPIPTSEAETPIVVRLIEDISCEPVGGSALMLDVNETVALSCSAAIELDPIQAQGGEITWVITVEFADAFSLDVEDGSETTIEMLGGNTYALTKAVNPESNVQELQFLLTASRTTCDSGEHLLTLTASAEVSLGSGVVYEIDGSLKSSSTSAVHFAQNLSAPVVDMTPVDFGTLKWDGEKWGTTYASSTLTITNSGACAIGQDYVVDLHINGSPELMPEIVEVSSQSENINVASQWDSQGGSLVTIPAGFSETAFVEIDLQLTPGEQVGTGEHTMEFVISVNSAP